MMRIRRNTVASVYVVTIYILVVPPEVKMSDLIIFKIIIEIN